MNKKLFSWKALAGLALLVAMGLTSCKQGTEIDPENPTSKPVTPTAKGTTLSGFKTCTELNNLIAGTTDITDNIKADGSVTITADCSNLEVTTTDYKVVLPSKTDATINLELTGTFKTKDGAVMEINDQALDVLNVTLPDADYVFNTPYSKVTLKSAIGKATITAPSDATAFKVADGGSIDYLKLLAGEVVVDGGEISGAVADSYVYTYGGSNPYTTDKGIVINGVVDAKGKTYFMENLRLEKGAAEYDVYANFYDEDGDAIYAINKIVVAADAEVWLNANALEVAGEGGKMGAKVGGFVYKIADKISDVTIPNYSGSNYISADVDKVTFEWTPTLMGTASNSVFKYNVRVFIWGKKYNDSFSYTFDKCEFADGAGIWASWNDDITSNPLLDDEGNQKSETYYYYWYRDANGDYQQSAEKSKLSDFTEDERKDPNNHFVEATRLLYTTPSPAYDKDFVATLNLNECKYNGAAYTSESTTDLMTSFTKPGESEWSKNNGSFYASVKYQIGGVGYKPVKVYEEGSSTSFKTIWDKE